jgi:L-lactate dehydrogenase complex protein LldG
MSCGREAFLERVRKAVAQGNRAGTTANPERGGVGYQGAGTDIAGRFLQELAAAGAYGQAVPRALATQQIVQLALTKNARRILLGRGPVLDSLELTRALQERGLHVDVVDKLAPDATKTAFFGANLGISGVTWAVAETGTLVMATGPADPRSLSLLPPIHVAVVGREQLLPDLFDLFDRLQTSPDALPACVSLITGPSKTGDIELKLVTGVHGPGEVHVVLI